MSQGNYLGSRISPQPESCAGPATSAQLAAGHRPYFARSAAVEEAGSPQPARRTSFGPGAAVKRGNTTERDYILNPRSGYVRRKLDSSDYSGQVIYSKPVVIHSTPAAPERVAPGAAGLSQTHSLTVPLLKVPDCTRQKAQVEIWQGGTMIRIQRDSVQGKQESSGKRGAVLDFSAQSRRNMLTLLNQLQKIALPLFLTLTLPGQTSIDAKGLNHAFHLLRVAAQRTFPLCSAVWKKELQDRKSGEFKGEVLPHFHLLAWGFPPHKFPFRRYIGKWVSITAEKGFWIERIWAMENGVKILKQENTLHGFDRFSEWLSRMWYEYVGSGEFKHYQAGTSVEQIKFAQGVKRYAAKYLGKEQLGFGNPYAAGRYWGVWQKDKLPWAERKVYECTDEQAVKIMRIARKYFESKTERRSCLGHFTIKLFVNDWEQWDRLVKWTVSDSASV